MLVVSNARLAYAIIDTTVLQTCGSEDQGCICKGVDEIASLRCLNCIMYLGGEEYTGQSPVHPMSSSLSSFLSFFHSPCRVESHLTDFVHNLGTTEYCDTTATDVKQTCLLSSTTLGTALRPSSTITPTSTLMSTSSQSSSSYPSEAITSTISIVRPTGATTDTGSVTATESPTPAPTESAENGAVGGGLVRGLKLCFVSVLVIVCGFI